MARHEQISDSFTVLSEWGTQSCTKKRKRKWMVVWGRSYKQKLSTAINLPIMIFCLKMVRKLSMQNESSTVLSIMFSRTMQIYAFRSICGCV